MSLLHATWSDLNQLWPPSTAWDQVLSELWLDETEGSICAATWGEKTTLAHALYTAAHLTILHRSTVDGGTIASQADGPTSVSFSVQANEGILGETPAGRMYLGLRKRVEVSVGVDLLVRGDD
jgi:hypothetical protein